MALKPWVKYTLAGVAVVVVAFCVLAGTGSYYFLRHLQTRSASETDSKRDFEDIQKKFQGRPPLIEIVDATRGEFRIQRVAHPEGRVGQTLHLMVWTAEDDHVMSSDLPLWLMRFSTINVLSHLGVAPERFRLTVEDLRRFGPGIVADFYRPGKNHVIIWVE